jgi:Oxidoreductase molybdopterin binding domain
MTEPEEGKPTEAGNAPPADESTPQAPPESAPADAPLIPAFAKPGPEPTTRQEPEERRPTPAPEPPRRGWLAGLAERPEIAIEVLRGRLEAQSRRDFLLFAAGTLATAVGAWWLLPDATKARLVPGDARNRLDTLAARVGLNRQRRDQVFSRALTFDDDVAEALYSKDRHVRTYRRAEVTPLRNNYNGRTPGPEYLATWALTISGLALGRTERLTIEELQRRFMLHEQATRLVCVEGWSAVAWWGGIRFSDLLAAFPPAVGARWASLRSSVNLSPSGAPDPYYVSIDLDTARHPQSLLATHQDGQPLVLAHGAPMRLLVPMKLGLKNIKAVTDIEYTATEPADYWSERGYSRYDGL